MYSVLRSILSLLILLTAFAVQAQSFPLKPVRIIVPVPPGGGADTLARIMAPQLSALWGQQVIIENKPGASGHIGADLVAQSAPASAAQAGRSGVGDGGAVTGGYHPAAPWRPLGRSAPTGERAPESRLASPPSYRRRGALVAMRAHGGNTDARR